MATALERADNAINGGRCYKIFIIKAIEKNNTLFCLGCFAAQYNIFFIDSNNTVENMLSYKTSFSARKGFSDLTGVMA